MVSDSELEKLLKKAIADIQKSNLSLNVFHDAIEGRWGFCYNGMNLDYIIDAVDYGGGGLTVKELIKILDEARTL